MPRAKVPTVQEINKLWRLHDGGDKAALKQLQNISATLAKRANERMRELRRRGYSSTAALTRAEYWIQNERGGSKGFSESRKLSPDLLDEQLGVVTSFLNWQTSTAPGEITRRENIIIGLNESDKVDTVVDERILDFLDSDAWSALKNLGSGEIIAAYYEMVNKGKSLQELIDIYNEYLEDEEMDLLDVLDKWKEPPKPAENPEENQENEEN